MPGEAAKPASKKSIATQCPAELWEENYIKHFKGLTKHYLKIQSVEVGNDAQYPNAECSISPSLATETPGSYCNAVAYLNEHQD